MIRALALPLLILSLALPCLAQFGPEVPDRAPQDPKDPALIASQKAFEENQAKHKGDADHFVRPGLLANRKDKTIRLWGRATHVQPSDPIEFWCIPSDSGKDYESLAVTYAKVIDVLEALKFIGMTPGRPVNFSENRVWPRGERVLMTFEWDAPAEGGGKPTPKKVRAEELMLDGRNGNKPLPPEGFVFTGSYWITPEGPDAKPMFAGDVMDGKAVASDYNERASILDVPRQAPKGVVYGTLKPNPAHKFTPGQPIQMVLEPEHKDGRTRVRDVSLHVSVPPGKDLKDGVFELKDPRGKPLTDKPTLLHVLAEFGKLTEAGQDPYVTLHVDGGLTLAQVQTLYATLGEMDVEKGIRIEAPPPGHLYYRAFFPNPQWRDRTRRLGRPWELHVGDEGGRITGTLILPADDIDDNGGKGDLTFPVKTPADLARTLAEKSDKWSASVYVFAKPELKYGDVMAFLRPGLETHPQMHVFLPEPKTPQP